MGTKTTVYNVVSHEIYKTLHFVISHFRGDTRRFICRDRYRLYSAMNLAEVSLRNRFLMYSSCKEMSKRHQKGTAYSSFTIGFTFRDHPDDEDHEFIPLKYMH